MTALPPSLQAKAEWLLAHPEPLTPAQQQAVRALAAPAQDAPKAVA